MGYYNMLQYTTYDNETCDGYCKRLYNPFTGDYEEIRCEHCKKSVAAYSCINEVQHVSFICDITHKPFMGQNIVYRYRNWYANEECVANTFFKLAVDSAEITEPVYYSAQVLFLGLSEADNPVFKITGDLKYEGKVPRNNRTEEDDYYPLDEDYDMFYSLLAHEGGE